MGTNPYSPSQKFCRGSRFNVPLQTMIRGFFAVTTITTGFSQFTDAGVSNPGFKESDVPSPVALEFKADNVIDWCEIAKERLSLGERIESEMTGVRFRGQLSLENGNTTDCIVKTTEGNGCFSLQLFHSGLPSQNSRKSRVSLCDILKNK